MLKLGAASRNGRNGGGDGGGIITMLRAQELNRDRQGYGQQIRADKDVSEQLRDRKESD